MEFIKSYLNAEKSESLIFVCIGMVSISFATYLLFKWSDSFYKGFAIPVITVGLIQLLVGGIVYLRTDSQIMNLETLHQQNSTDFKNSETTRMNVVMKNFLLYKKVEVAFVVIGLLVLLTATSKQFWVGVGVGMLLQGALMLTADIFAERRGAEYTNHIDNL
jgi:hypothetical protein